MSEFNGNFHVASIDRISDSLVGTSSLFNLNPVRIYGFITGCGSSETVGKRECPVILGGIQASLIPIGETCNSLEDGKGFFFASIPESFFELFLELIFFLGFIGLLLCEASLTATWRSFLIERLSHRLLILLILISLDSLILNYFTILCSLYSPFIQISLYRAISLKSPKASRRGCYTPPDTFGPSWEVLILPLDLINVRVSNHMRHAHT